MIHKRGVLDINISDYDISPCRCKCHIGYNTCERCTQRGQYIDRKVTYPETDAPLQGNIHFHEMRDEVHQTSQSPLLELSIHMVTHFPLDYMHIVCLGVMKKLLHLWVKGPLGIRLDAKTVNKISETLLKFRNLMPREFCRRPTSLREICNWNAVE